MGRFLPVKNHEFILSVFREMARERPDSVLVLVGDGPLRADVESAAQSLGISDSVKFLGVRTDVSKLMSAMDLFVLPLFTKGCL